MIKAVLFDLDETLLVRNAAIRAFIDDQYARQVKLLAATDREEFVLRFLALEDEGRTPKTVVYPALVHELGLAPSVAADLLADYQAVYPRYVVLAVGARETLVGLRARGIKTGIITNGSAVVQNGKIDATGLRPLLDIVLVSDVEGMSKPDRRIFERALQQLDIAAGEAMFVGDNPAADVEGARQAGLLAIWYHSTTDWPDDLVPPTHTITALQDIIALSGRLASA